MLSLANEVAAAAAVVPVTAIDDVEQTHTERTSERERVSVNDENVATKRDNFAVVLWLTKLIMGPSC